VSISLTDFIARSVRWFVLAHASCRIELLVLVQVDLHEEGHDETEVKLLSQTLVPFGECGAGFSRS
jgi:hypothetical protein